MSQLDKIKARYYREVIAGTGIWHHGDCRIFSIAGICTCGLIHDLLPLGNAEEIYPDFKKDYKKHDDNLYILECEKKE